jgi:hypothetical protein
MPRKYLLVAWCLVLASGAAAETACRVTPASIEENLQMGLITDLVITIENIGDDPFAVNPSVSLPFTIVHEDGPNPVPPSGSHVVFVRFWALQGGTFSTVLETGASACASVPITIHAVGAEPGCAWTEAPAADFGSVGVGGQGVRMLTFRNSGNTTLADVTFASEGDRFYIYEGAGPVTLLPNQSQYVGVAFVPADTVVSQGSIAASTDACEPLLLQGRGVGPLPQIVLEYGSLDFGDVCAGSSAVRWLTVRNDGDNGARVRPQVDPPFYCYFNGDDWGDMYLVPHWDVDLQLVYRPLDTDAHADTLTFDNPFCAVVPLRGHGMTPQAVCEPSETAVDFGEVPLGLCRERDVVVANTGCLPLTIAPSLPGDDGFAIVVNDGPATVAAGRRRTLRVRFQPGVTGEATCGLRLGSAACPDIPLAGTGVPTVGGCRPVPAVLDLGPLPTGLFRTLSFQLANDSGYAAAVSLPDRPDSVQFLSGGGDQVLEAGARVTVQARFYALESGPFAWTLPLGCAACDPLEVVGVGTDGTDCRLLPASLDFGTVTVGDTATLPWLVHNAGAATMVVHATCDDPAFTWSPIAAHTVPADRFLAGWVRFAPAAPGVHESQLDLGHDACAPLGLRGEGVLAAPGPQVVPADPGAEPADGTCLRIVWSDQVADHGDAQEWQGRLELVNAAGDGLIAWNGRLAATGDGAFTAWTLSAGVVNLAEPPRFAVLAAGIVEPPAEVVTLAAFRYRIPSGGRADFAVFADGGGREGWPSYRDAAEPGRTVLVAGSAGEHLLAIIRPDGVPALGDPAWLEPASPNPFNPQTTLAFTVAQSGPVTLEVFDVCGRHVATLLDEHVAAGRHELSWRGRTDDGRELPSGTYYARLVAGGQVITGKLTLLR